MLLITMREWFGPSKIAIRRSDPSPMQPETRLRGFVTNLPLGEAIERIQAYGEAFRQRYASFTALEFELISVSQIDDLTDEQIELALAVHVEKLVQNREEMDQKYA